VCILSLAARRKLNTKIGSSIWSVGSNFASRALGFLFTPIFIRLLPPEEYGIYSLYVSLMGIFTVLTTFEISGSVIYRGIARFDGNGRAEFLSSALGAVSALNLVSLAIYIIFRRYINAITSLGTLLTVFLFFQVFLNAATGIYFAEKRYSEDYKKVALINLATGICSPLLSLIFIRLGGGGKSRIIAPLITSAFISAPLIFSLIKKGKKLLSVEPWKFIFRLTVPMLPHYLALSLMAQSDEIIIARTLGDVELGKYSAAHSVGFLLSLLTGGILLVLSPWTVKKQKEEDAGLVSYAISSSAKLVSFATLIFLTLIPEIFGIIAEGEYFEAMRAVYPVAWSVVFLFLSVCASNCLVYFEKPHLITKNSLICAALCLILNTFLIDRIGYIGGAYSTMLSYVFLFFLNRKSLKKVSKNNISVSFSCHFCLIIIVFALLTFLLRGSFSARIILLLAILASALPEIKSFRQERIF